MEAHPKLHALCARTVPVTVLSIRYTFFMSEGFKQKKVSQETEDDTLQKHEMTPAESIDVAEEEVVGVEALESRVQELLADETLNTEEKAKRLELLREQMQKQITELKSLNDAEVLENGAVATVGTEQRGTHQEEITKLNYLRRKTRDDIGIIKRAETDRTAKVESSGEQPIEGATVEGKESREGVRNEMLELAGVFNAFALELQRRGANGMDPFAERSDMRKIAVSAEMLKTLTGNEDIQMEDAIKAIIPAYEAFHNIRPGGNGYQEDPKSLLRINKQMDDVLRYTERIRRGMGEHQGLNRSIAFIQGEANNFGMYTRQKARALEDYKNA